MQRVGQIRTQPQRLVQRAQIILMAAGVPSQDIAGRLRVSRPTVQLWRERFLALRLAGLEKDAPRPGRLPRIGPEAGRGRSDVAQQPPMPRTGVRVPWPRRKELARRRSAGSGSATA